MPTALVFIISDSAPSSMESTSLEEKLVATLRTEAFAAGTFPMPPIPKGGHTGKFS